MSPPRNSDNKQGKPSDHLTLICEPINVINNVPLQQTRNITFKPVTDSGLILFGMWIENKSLDTTKGTHSVNMKTDIFYKTVRNQVNVNFPEKHIKITSDDAPTNTRIQ